MSDADRQTIETFVESLAGRSEREHIPELSRQFAAKLERIADSERAPRKTLDTLRLFWRMLETPDELVPWRAKAWIMAALAYFAAPLDLVPDFAGKAGYIDDAIVVGIVERRVADAIAAFRAAEAKG